MFYTRWLMDNLLYHPKLQTGRYYDERNTFTPKRRKKIFPHLGATVLVRPPQDAIESLYHRVEVVIKVKWTLSSRCNGYSNIEFHTDLGSTFYLREVIKNHVKVLWPRRSILIGFDTYYTNEFGETLREQLISPQGDVAFEAFREGHYDYFN